MHSLHKMHKIGEEGGGRSCLPVGCIISEIAQRTSINFNIRTVCTKMYWRRFIMVRMGHTQPRFTWN